MYTEFTTGIPRKRFEPATPVPLSAKSAGAETFCSYLYKSIKAPTPLCSCPEKAEQRARHLMTDCSLFSKERPAVFRKLPLTQKMQYHINTVEVSRLIKN